jgi:uncharacterized protein (TIGR02246 family)
MGGDEVDREKAAIEEMVKSIQEAWNAGDGKAFATPFAEDADYVVVNGMHIKGREAIGQGHQQIFDTFYKGSTNRLTLENVRFIQPDVAIAHVQAHLTFYEGENTREATARSTWVLARDDGKWSIAAFQNTPIVPPGEQR